MSLIAITDQERIDAGGQLDQSQRGQLGQFMTPPGVATQMASMFEKLPDKVRLLEAGAGVGSLIAAFVSRCCEADQKPKSLHVTAYEKSPALTERLHVTLSRCADVCAAEGVDFEAQVFEEDFISAAANLLVGDLRGGRRDLSVNVAILNPPYHKIRTSSEERKTLRSVGIEASNLYSGFVALAVKLLEPDGELVAITPRSFCNGPYFRPFRELLLDHTDVRRIHVFHSRKKAFSGDDVLQENIIYRVVKRPQSSKVVLSSSDTPDEKPHERGIAFSDLVLPNDPNRFIHLALTEEDQGIARSMRNLSRTLEDLAITVSTGRVVDFRATEFIKDDPEPGTVPLIYPCHFKDGYIDWPKTGGKKPNAIEGSLVTAALLVPKGHYVLVRRFSSKEERKRVVAAVYDPDHVQAEAVGFENHLNFFHRDGAGLPKSTALGLAVYLNSTLVDSYFRQFNGHTQVNATDLRSLLYPDEEQLQALGDAPVDILTDQGSIDDRVERIVL